LVVVIDVPVVNVGARDRREAVIVAAVTSASVSAVVPMSTIALTCSQPRWIASKPYAVPEGEATARRRRGTARTRTAPRCRHRW
jgi:hypothetical protein